MKKTILNIRSRLLTILVEKTKPLYAHLFHKAKKGWQISIEQLQQYPSKSLGKDLADFLIKEKFDLMAGLESHDVYHIILDYSTKVEDEARMQFFLLGNGKRSLYAVGTSLIAFLTMPEQWTAFRQAYQRGKKSLKVHLWDFRYLLQEKTTTLKALLKGKSIIKVPIF